MGLTGKRTFVGFGFGAIQAGLFLYEAFHSGQFGRLVVAEIRPDMVRAVRSAGGSFSVNIAHPDRVESACVGPVEILDPETGEDRRRLIEAVAGADEIATAVPSVHHYVSDSPGSVHRILAQGLSGKASSGGAASILYAAENNNQAAEILEASVLQAVPPDAGPAVLSRCRFLNTVIGKMSGSISSAPNTQECRLAPVAPGFAGIFLVEEFNRILISRIPPGSVFLRGITCFQEKDDLLPFEEAKLYGHNATHALAAYMGAVLGVRLVADLRRFPDLMAFLRAAFLEESGKALIRKHAGVDPLFTADGYRTYADDLLARMVNPFLLDSIERVGRDPERKLAWDDRLIGTMRLAHSVGIEPRRYALGAAAALAWCGRSTSWLEGQWDEASPVITEKSAMISLIDAASACLHTWIDSGFKTLP